MEYNTVITKDDYKFEIRTDLPVIHENKVYCVSIDVYMENIPNESIWIDSIRYDKYTHPYLAEMFLNTETLELCYPKITLSIA